MAFIVNDSCISCGACKNECPVGAISMGEERAAIVAGSCVECGACRAACPADAIFQE